MKMIDSGMSPLGNSHAEEIGLQGCLTENCCATLSLNVYSKRIFFLQNFKVFLTNLVICDLRDGMIFFQDVKCVVLMLKTFGF